MASGFWAEQVSGAVAALGGGGVGRITVEDGEVSLAPQLYLAINKTTTTTTTTTVSTRRGGGGSLQDLARLVMVTSTSAAKELLLLREEEEEEITSTATSRFHLVAFAVLYVAGAAGAGASTSASVFPSVPSELKLLASALGGMQQRTNNTSFTTLSDLAHQARWCSPTALSSVLPSAFVLVDHVVQLARRRTDSASASSVLLLDLALHWRMELVCSTDKQALMLVELAQELGWPAERVLALVENDRSNTKFKPLLTRRVKKDKPAAAPSISASVFVLLMAQERYVQAGKRATTVQEGSLLRLYNSTLAPCLLGIGGGGTQSTYSALAEWLQQKDEHDEENDEPRRSSSKRHKRSMEEEEDGGQQQQRLFVPKLAAPPTAAVAIAASRPELAALPLSTAASSLLARSLKTKPQLAASAPPPVAAKSSSTTSSSAATQLKNRLKRG